MKELWHKILLEQTRKDKKIAKFKHFQIQINMTLISAFIYTGYK